MLTVSQAWKTAYPEAAVGTLAMHNVTNPERHAGLDQLKGELEKQLRARFTDRKELRALEPLQAYRAYFKRFSRASPFLASRRWLKRCSPPSSRTCS
jgi:DNA/RNA-binding domain of Phe-tRNA-synthetase-like protein